jgi:hypothetical protein
VLLSSAAFCVAIHTEGGPVTVNTCMAGGHLGLSMAAEAGPAVGTGRMACSTLTVCSTMGDGEGVVEGCACPGSSGVTLRTLPGVVVGRCGPGMAAAAVGGILGCMVEGRARPGGGTVAL